MTTTTSARRIPPGTYRSVCGIELHITRADMEQVDCTCGRSYTHATLGDPARGELTCASCGATSTATGPAPCPVCGTARRRATDPMPTIEHPIEGE
ncbi:hypothetical protein UG55_103525 [Frankia sp. EI5c]|uniref:hypothetical protein n=1 Tax=Frankia sp. EI5c TaxID=683316 RepID=UPI0007C2396E|nr:hypothetical protein [Frankia sp. EI5c]OAA23591.1 hypothetical protein UG55_103525 [Frankia sp. EI5c]